MTKLAGGAAVGVGVVLGVLGAYSAYEARLHNSIVAATVRNPWPGYVIAVFGVAMVITGVVLLVRRSARPPARPER